MENIIVSGCLLGLSCRYDGKSKPVDKVIALKDKYNLIPVCPEIMGGLSTPRMPSERCGEKVMMNNGNDVTAEYRRGAEQALLLAELFGCKRAVLKEKSPSCGCGRIYDGSFSKTLVDGNGVTAELFLEKGIEVFGETKIEEMKK